MHPCVSLPAAMVAALVKAQGAIRSLAKDGENKQQGFSYVSSEKVVYFAASALGAHGLHLMRQSTEVGPWERQEVQGKERATVYLVAAVTCSFVLCHESGSVGLSYTLPAVQSAGRPADKAVLATCTELLGYALRDVLLIARGGDDDVRHRKDPGADEMDTTGDVTGRPDGESPAGRGKSARGESPKAQAKPESAPAPAQEAPAEAPKPSPLMEQANRLAARLPGGWDALDAYARAKDGKAARAKPGKAFGTLMAGLPEGARGDLLTSLEERTSVVEADGDVWPAMLEGCAGDHQKAWAGALDRLGLGPAGELTTAQIVGGALYLMGL